MTSTYEQKVFCLGLGRTGTKSLRIALEMLGFGPCYDFSTIMEGGGKDFEAWTKIGSGDGTTEDLKSLIDNYRCALDYPVVMFSDMLFPTYPDAKYILTTRDPAKWEKSIHSTVLLVQQKLRQLPTRSTIQEQVFRWVENSIEKKYHRGRLFTHAQQELLDHNERVKQLIPPEKLLVYEVGEGWERLVEFLGVPIPMEPFPHLNDTAHFQEVVNKRFSEEKNNLPGDKVYGSSTGMSDNNGD